MSTNKKTADYEWEDLPKSLNCFTIRNAAMMNLDNNKVIQHYSANTRITVVQKCMNEKGTFYRTNSAKQNGLNYAFEASAFGLPNEKTPPVPSTPFLKTHELESRTHHPVQNKKKSPTVVLPKGGEVRRHGGWLGKIFRRKNG